MEPEEWERARLARDRRPAPRPPTHEGGAPAFVGYVASPPAKIAVGSYFLARPAAPFGAEAEGQAGTLQLGPGYIPTYLLGPHTPSPGDYLICRFVGNRWVAERGMGGGPYGGITGMIPNCFCSPTPATLSMWSGDPACNFQMFQNAIITWQATPAAFQAANLPDHSYLSYPMGFPDPVSGGSTFYYYLTCQYNVWTLTRIFLESPYGSPFRDAVLYQWVMGGAGNQCGSQPSTYALNPDFQDWADCIVAAYPAYASLEPLGYDPATGKLSDAATSALQSIYRDYAAGTTRGCGPPPPVTVNTIAANAFHLDQGEAFPGSDLSCSVKIDG